MIKGGLNKWNSQKRRINIVILLLEIAIATSILITFVIKLDIDKYDSLSDFMVDAWGRALIALLVLFVEACWIVRDIMRIRRMIK